MESLQWTIWEATLTIKRWWKKFNSEKSVADKRRPGRPCAKSTVTKVVMKKAAGKFRQSAQKFGETTGRDWSPSVREDSTQVLDQIYRYNVTLKTLFLCTREADSGPEKTQLFHAGQCPCSAVKCCQGNFFHFWAKDKCPENSPSLKQFEEL